MAQSSAISYRKRSRGKKGDQEPQSGSTLGCEHKSSSSSALAAPVFRTSHIPPFNLTTMSDAILSQGVGYGVVLGLGLFFSALMVGITKLQNRYTIYQASSAAEFASASHSVKPGLIAAGIVSAWTWAATLLQSSAVAYRYGISGPWWYAVSTTRALMSLLSPSMRCLTPVRGPALLSRRPAPPSKSSSSPRTLLSSRSTHPTPTRSSR